MTNAGHPRDSFDAALIPHMRERLRDAYARFRAVEKQALAVAGDAVRVAYRERPCPLCGSSADNGTLMLQAHGLDLITCAHCALTYSRHITMEDVDAAEDSLASVARAAAQLHSSAAYLELETARARYYLDRLRSRGARCGPFLEVGCGTGTLLVEAAAQGWQVLGMEPIDALATVARRRGVPVLSERFPRGLPAGGTSAAVAAALDVLEHIPEPVPFLRALRNRLAPGGLLLIQVPNWDSLLVRLEGCASSVICPGHWSYFTSATLPRVAEAAGLRTLAIETVVSEWDRIAAFPEAEVQAWTQRLRPGAETFPLSPDDLHDLKLGYKLVGIFIAD